MSKKINNLETMRHSASHVLAQAVLEIFPQAKLAIGPAIENGFYYDFDLPRSLTPKDLAEIEKRMKRMVKKNQKFRQYFLPKEKSVKFLKGQPYKIEMVKELKDKKVSLYESVDQAGNVKFTDMCSGPHVASAREIGAFRLTKVAGAYWRGNEKNKMLQRVYGVAFATQKDLDNYLKMIEEAEKRDHRKLGKELDLFHIDEMVGLGLPLWHPKGALLWRIIEDFWYAEHIKSGYDLVRTPHIGNKSLWETSGHWGFFNESMYPPIEAGQSLKESQDKEKIKEPETYLLKPMNCPFHVRIYKNSLHSYREFPFRWAECGTVYRFEKKGELSGLTRVRGFTQDDAHIICRADQVEEELKRVIDFILFIYKSFGFKMEDVNVYLSLRDPKNKKKYAGNDQGWNLTQKVLEKVAKEKKLNYKKEIGEAAFYGPKLDFKIKDALGREWQCSTLQFDFNLPEKFDMTFVNDKGKEERPYMLHRALFGSFERFIGLLIEHYAGAFPVWLAPIQVQIIPVSSQPSHLKAAKKITEELREAGVRAETDYSNETVGNKIRKSEGQKIPYMLVIGDQEAQGNCLNVRVRGKKETAKMTRKQFMEKILKEIRDKK